MFSDISFQRIEKVNGMEKCPSFVRIIPVFTIFMFNCITLSGLFLLDAVSPFFNLRSQAEVNKGLVILLDPTCPAWFYLFVDWMNAWFDNHVRNWLALLIFDGFWMRHDTSRGESNSSWRDEVGRGFAVATLGEKNDTSNWRAEKTYSDVAGMKWVGSPLSWV